MQSPFRLDIQSDFRQWADWKRERAVAGLGTVKVEVGDGARLSVSETEALKAACSRSNFVIYRSVVPLDDQGVLTMGRSLGLYRLDRNLCADDSGVSALRVAGEGVKGEYIPYTNRSLNWHTDGYYNETANPIRGFILHCSQPALSGGENEIIDPEMLYLHLRDRDPAMISQLSLPGAMTVPANRDGDVEIRAETSGPVYQEDAVSGDLLTRYTARKRHIQWIDAPEFARALAGLELAIAEEQVPVYRYRLQRNEGVICNNVLHTRRPFDDEGAEDGRCMLRARYHDRVIGTGIRETYLRG